MKARIIYPDDKKPWIQITSAKIIFPKIISSKSRKSSKTKPMNYLKITSIVTIGIIAILSVAAIMGLQLTEIIAEEIQKPEYLTAEGVEITGVFKFREGDELVSIQQFTQVKGFQRSEPFTFTMQKVVGNTPLLHSHADEAFLFRNSEVQKQDWNPFDVDIILATGPYVKRDFSYSKCYVKNYFVRTLSDNEEGYFNKGFAVVEEYLLECREMDMYNPALDEMNSLVEDQKANTTSSMDLRDTSTWSSNYKSQKPDSP